MLPALQQQLLRRFLPVESLVLDDPEDLGRAIWLGRCGWLESLGSRRFRLASGVRELMRCADVE